MIDLVCFRRLGHNEQDEPIVTQPLMYKKIAQHPGTRKLYADKLEQEGVIAGRGRRDGRRRTARRWTRASTPTSTILYELQAPARGGLVAVLGHEVDDKADTALPLAELKTLAERLTAVPQNFKLHPRVERMIADRRQMGEGKLPLDWGMAENLAYASLLKDGYPGAPLRPGRRARHVLPPPRGAARPEPREVGRRHVTSRCSTSREDQGDFRRDRFGAVGRGGARLRVRLRDRRSRTSW